MLWVWLGALWSFALGYRMLRSPVITSPTLKSALEYVPWQLGFLPMLFALFGCVEFENTLSYLLMMWLCGGAVIGVLGLMCYSFWLISTDSSPYERKFGRRASKKPRSMLRCWRDLLGGDGWWWRWLVPSCALPVGYVAKAVNKR
eukprot:TRINITY_DN10344_c0_g1_i1.p1 TRINITY_DN10344_c0_g1~~TRINITY_DN10344_c0_g1_i1.p1  ORF type:complete len:145 (-),score=18.01 TRINITY_DN10344_c0_g1_i1:284-718(-)